MTGGALPALADTTTIIAQAAQTASLTGVVRGDTGAPIAGATVTAHGATTLSAKTAADGTFTLAVVPGVYQIEVRAAGFTSASQSDVAVTSGASVPLTIALTRPSLSSLQTIGRTGTISRGSGGSINTGTAASGFISAQAFQNYGNPQINDVLQHLPDVTIQHMGSQPDTTIIVGGVQPYETQVLIDGHPIATGQYGVFISQYFPSYLIGGIETQSGPGNTTPFANLAVGGTANILTPNYTNRPTGEIQVGVDEYEQQFSHALFTGSAGNLQYIVGAGVDGYNGPYFQKNICNFDGGVISSCGDGSGSFFSKGELLKLRYNFSQKTSFELGFIGAWGGYSPQGTAWGTENGQLTVPECLTPTPGNPGSAVCSNPGFSYYNGRSTNSISYYPGSSVYNNQTLFDAQFRTAIGNDTLLIRPYLGNIEPENVLGAGEAYSPDFYSFPGATPANDPAFFGDGTVNNPGACASAYGSLTNGSGQGNVVNGQTECFATPYQTFEIDKLYGSTISYLHPVGDDLYNFTYDFHGDSTFAYINSPDDISVPLSSNRYSTFSLTGDIHRIRNLGIDFGLYDTLFKAIGVKPASLADSTLVGFDRSISRFDPHIAFTFRPTSSVAYRAAYGTSTTFPYLGQLSGNATYEQPAQSLGVYALGGTLTEKNANLAPEVSIAESVGMDKRFRNNSVLSVDLQNTVIHDVFEPLTSSYPANGGLEGVFSPINVASLRTQLATLKYNYAPTRGLGYNAAVAAERSLAEGIPAALYSAGTASFPVNNVQICGNGVAAPGIPTCIPYLKGYGQITYTFGDGSFAALGVDYEGKNNAYFQPPMALADLTLRKRVTRNLDLNLSVQNLFNTNNYGTYLATPGAGTPLVAGSVDAAGNLIQTSFVPTLVSAPARQIRISGRYHFGR